MRISRNVRNFGKIIKKLNHYNENAKTMNNLEKIKAKESIDGQMWNFHEMTRGQPQYKEFESTLSNYFGKVTGGKYFPVMEESEEIFRKWNQ